MITILQFININLAEHREIVTEFRRDSFKASFGDDIDFDKENYLHWLKEKIIDYPNGFVLAKKANKYVGQIELSVRKYNDIDIGYVHLYYLIFEERGKGLGQVLHDYAKRFFKAKNINEFHLRVSPSNTAAIRYYRKMGMNEIGPEMNGKVIRMKGIL